MAIVPTLGAVENRGTQQPSGSSIRQIEITMLSQQHGICCAQLPAFNGLIVGSAECTVERARASEFKR